MSKVCYKKKRNNIIKSLGFMVASVFAILSLASCKANSDVYSNIDADSTYSSIGDYSVTNEDVFEEMAYNGADELDEYVVETICKEYYDQVVSAIEDPSSDEYAEHHDDYLEELREDFIIETYSVDDFDSYFEVNNKDDLAEMKQETLDTLYTDGINLSSSDFEELVAVEDYDDETLVDISWDDLSTAQQETLQLYYDTLAQKLFAKEYLEENTIADYEDDNNDDDLSVYDDDYVHYYTDDDIEDYWDENYYYKDSYADAIMIRFVSDDEVDETLETFGIKLYKSNFYFIKQDGVIEDGNAVDLTDSEYSTWYEDFDFTDAENSSNYSPVDDSEMLQLYVEMYNYIYPYKNQLPERSDVEEVANNNSTSNRRDVTAQILNASETETYSATEFYEYMQEKMDDDDFEDAIEHTAEDLEDVNSSLRNFLYEDLDDYDYSTEGESNDDYYYMAYKFDVNCDDLISSGNYLYHEEDENGDVTETNEDGTTFTADSSKIDRERCSDLVAEIVDKLEDEDLTDSYIEDAIDDARDDCKIYIYDEALSVSYSVSYTDYYNKTAKTAIDDDVIAKIKYDDTVTYVSTSELYTTLEASSGITSAIDLLTTQIIESTEEYAETESDEDLYYTSLNNLLTSFANDGLDDSGYDSDIGKYNFLMIYFHTTDVDEIIDDYYRVSAASSELLNDYVDDSALIELLTNYADEAYENSFTMSATNLQVYVDMDEDGDADDDFDWDTECTLGSTETTYREAAIELIDQIIEILENGTDAYADTLSDIVDEYDESTRFTNGHDTSVEDDEYDPTDPETYWAEFKRIGLYITTDDYDDVTNSTDSSTIATELKEELMDIYSRKDFIVGDSAPEEYLDTDPYSSTSSDGLSTDDGYNLLVVTDATVNASAEFTEADDLSEVYTDLYYYYNEELVYIENLYNDSDELSYNQVWAYLLEYIDNDTDSTLPSDVQEAIDSFLSDVYTKYTDDATQRELLIYWCEAETGDDFTFQDTYTFLDGSTTTYADRFAEIQAINERDADDYSSCDEFQYTSVYDDWWGDLESYINNKYGISED